MDLKTRALLLATSSLMFTAAAHAQQQPAATTTAANDAPGGLEEIVVTAQRRSENLQNVPIAISAVPASTISKLNITNPQDVTQLVPAFTFNRMAQGAAPFIRGVGTSSTFVGNEPSVAIFVDDVYIPSGSAAIFEFNNISSVEVLKGPQGTLFGRNATGGVIHVHTREPEHTTGVEASVGYGNYNTITGNVYATTGLTETIAVNISAYIANQNDGWGQYIGTGQQASVPVGTDAFTSKSHGVTGKILFEPDDLTKIRLGATYSRRKSDEGLANRPVPGYTGRNGVTGGGFYDSFTNSKDFYITNYWNANLKVERDLGNAKLVSISAYGVTDAVSLIDLDATQQRFVDALGGYYGRTFTQEVQLLSNNDSKIKWILGGFYLHDYSYANIKFEGLAYGNTNQRSFGSQRTDSISGFAQMTAEVLDRTNMTIGVRYTSDKRKFFGFYDIHTLPLPGTDTFVNGPLRDSKTFGNVTGRFTLDHKFTNDIMGYISYNRGFKSGVYNLSGVGATSTIAANLQPADPETLDSYTAGVKTELFDRRLRFNVEGFYYKYKSIQVQQNLPIAGTILVSAGAATIKGLEFEAQAVPVRNLTLSANISVQNGRYDDFANGPFFILPNNGRAVPTNADCSAVPATVAVQGASIRCNLRGAHTVNTPPFSSNLSALYHIDSSIGGFDLSGSWAHGGNYYFEPDNFAATRQPHTNIVNASLKWQPFNSMFSLTVWGANITNQKYFSYIGESGSSGPKGSPAAPRTYGVRAGVKF